MGERLREKIRSSVLSILFGLCIGHQVRVSSGKSDIIIKPLEDNLETERLIHTLLSKEEWTKHSA